MTFHVGQKVVCVDAEEHDRYTPFRCEPGLEGLARGAVYTIRYVGTCLSVGVVRLEEIHRTYNRFVKGENVYAAVRFRPIVERKTDISIFSAMLNTSKQGVDA